MCCIEVMTTETNITVGQRIKAERKSHVTDRAVSQSDRMAARKPLVARSSERPLFPSASTMTQLKSPREERKTAFSHIFTLNRAISCVRAYKREMVTLDFIAQRSTTSAWSKNSHSTALASLGKRLSYKSALVHAVYSCKRSVFGGIFAVKRAVMRESRLKCAKNTRIT